MCFSRLKPEITDHYLLCCKLHADVRLDLLNNAFVLNQIFFKFFVEQLVNVLLYSSENFTFSTIAKILSNTIKIINRSKLGIKNPC